MRKIFKQLEMLLMLMKDLEKKKLEKVLEKKKLKKILEKMKMKKKRKMEVEEDF
jgi:hypothetical protein